MDRLHLDDEGRLTLHVRVRWVALVVALALHVAVGYLASLLPEPKKPPTRIQLTLARPPSGAPPPTGLPAPEPPTTRPPPPPKPRARRRPSPAPTKVAPVLPPSREPPPTRVELPLPEPLPEPSSEPSPEPAAPETWEEQLERQLAATRPRRRAPTGVLAPSLSTLSRVAGADPRLHDERTEQRLMEDYGTFFRRGLEALRGHWRPAEVLRDTERDPARRCGREDRMTYAVAIIDHDGKVLDVDLRTPSGCPELDEEAVAAFKRVASFPHPPKGIFVGPDGTEMETARYPVRFLVTFNGGFQLDWR